MIQAFNNSNWLQNVENGIDPFHVSFLHGDVWTPMAVEPEKITFEETDWSVIYKALRSGRKEGEYNYREHHIIMRRSLLEATLQLVSATTSRRRETSSGDLQIECAH